MGKARDGSECYTRQNKSGGNYVTCEGTQKGGKSKSIPPQSARARGRRSAAARKLTTRPEAAGRIETGDLNPGVVMPEGASASFEGLFGSVAPVEPEEAEQGVNEDILSEVIPGLFEGVGPIGERGIYKEDFLEVLGVISERSAERETEKQEIFAKYEGFSSTQLGNSFRKFWKDTHPGFTYRFPRSVRKERIISLIVKHNMPDSYLPKSAAKVRRGEPTREWTIEGNVLDDDEDDGLPWWAREYGFKIKEVYAMGGGKLTAKLTDEEVRQFRNRYQETLEDWTDFYRETRTKKSGWWFGWSNSA